MTYRRRLKYYLIKLCRLQDSPKSVAGGFALGTIIHFYPTSGFGALFAVGLSKMFRTNCVAATVAWAITLPLFPIFFYINILIGCIFVGPAERSISKFLYNTSHIGWKDVLLLGKAFLIGSIINGIVALIILWWIGYVILKRYRKRIMSFICQNI